MKLCIATAARTIALAFLVIGRPTVAEIEQEEMAGELLHSDLPLFGAAFQNKWPQSIESNARSEVIEIGCTSRVAFGDWEYRPAGGKKDDTQWHRFSNYGAFHCAAIASEAMQREKLDHAAWRYSFFAYLGRGRTRGEEVELWALQQGTTPGSDYLLLSRKPSEELIKSFTVLQRQCPRGNRRDGTPIDVFSTAYCAIKSQQELIRLARQMATRSPLGTLDLAEQPIVTAGSEAQSTR
jgi:hypothetical protein